MLFNIISSHFSVRLFGLCIRQTTRQPTGSLRVERRINRVDGWNVSFIRGFHDKQIARSVKYKMQFLRIVTT